LALGLLVAAAPGALAGRVDIPLRIPLESIGQVLATQLDATYREGPCRSVRLEAPKLEAADGRLHLTGSGAAALGLEMFGKCQNAATWRGAMQFTLEPHLDAAGHLRVRVVDSRLTDPGGDATALRFIWDLSKRHLHPRLERFSYDFGASREALFGILRSTGLTPIQVMQPRIETQAIVLPIAIDIPDRWLTAQAPAFAPAAPLTEAELDALDRALEPWDAFLSYAIKQIAADSDDSALRQRLFTLLIESRYQLSAILSGSASAAGDPLRALFIEAWGELRALLAGTQRYRVFIDAGDALMALDRAAPGLGMQISADGLRQLARTLRPGATGDPLAFAWTVDPQLRQLFNVADLPQAPPAAPPGRSWLDFFISRAHADSEAQALDRWVPKREELDPYASRIGQLLQKAASAELQRSALAAPYDAIYRNLMPTTALIESCWRQYVVRGGKVTYLRSAAASVGIMQINQRVWRGFYEAERLRWDIAYNIRAGAQILLRYVKDYAIPYAERSGNVEHVPRAAYAVYNAGPRAAGRFNKAEPHPREKRVDDHLWTLYQGIAAGGRADLRTCAVEIAAASR
jgi:hypothetical protein